MSTNSTAKNFLISVLILTSTVATLLDTFTINFVISSVGSDLHASTHEVQWLLASFPITFTLGLICGGRFGDRFGRKWLLISGLVCLLVTALWLSLFASTIATIIWLRVVQGLGAGVAAAQIMGVIQDEYEGLPRIRALVSIGVAGTVTGVVFPLISAVVTDLYPPQMGWRIVLGLGVPILIPALVAALWYRPRRARIDVPGQSLDLVGMVLFGLVSCGVTLTAVDAWFADHWWQTLLVTATLFAVLLWWEQHYTSIGHTALFIPALFRSPQFLIANASSMLWYGAIVARMTVLTIYMLNTGFWSALTVSLAFVPGACVRVLTSWWSSRLFTRWGYRTVTYTLTLETLSMTYLWLSVLFGARGWWLFLAILVASVSSNLASGITDSIMKANVLSYAPEAHRGVAASFQQLTGRISTTLIIAICTGLMLGDSENGLFISVSACLLFMVSAWLLTWGRTFSDQRERRSIT